MTAKSWKKISSKIIHRNPWYILCEDKVLRPDGKLAKYFVVRKDPGVVIIPYDGKKVYLVNQYRYTLQKRYWELPAGKSEKESTLMTAKRELMEEAGLVAKKWKLLGKFAWAPGFSDQIGYAYLAHNLKHVEAHREETESDMEVRAFTIKEIDKMIQTGKIIDGGTIAPWYMLKTYLNNS